MKKMLLLITDIFSAIVLFAQENEPDHINYFPNYHPLIVHFPVVLLIVAAFMQIGLLFFKSREYNYSITIITVVGFITALLAAYVFHAHAAMNINAQAKEMFEQHEKLAFITLWVSGFASAFKITALFIRKKWVEIISAALLIGCATSVSLAGHLGSKLVYQQGIGPKNEKLEKEH